LCLGELVDWVGTQFRAEPIDLPEHLIERVSGRDGRETFVISAYSV
jgi:hypothetical protein